MGNLIVFFLMFQALLAHASGYQCEITYEKPGTPKENVTLATNNNTKWVTAEFLHYFVVLWHQELPFSKMHLKIAKFVTEIDLAEIAVITGATGQGSLYIEDEKARLDFICEQI